jgi:hypothetical protein
MQSETLPFYQMADGLLLPTLYDPFPNVILEAMACGLPVITTTGCGGAEFIVQGSNGYVCDALDIPALQESVNALPAGRWALQKAARPRAHHDLHQRTALGAAALSLSGFGEITMRILFVIDGLPGGGAEKVVLTLAAFPARRRSGVAHFAARCLRVSVARGLDYQVVPIAAVNRGAS